MIGTIRVEIPNPLTVPIAEAEIVRSDTQKISENILRKGFYEGFADVFSSKPTVKKYYCMLIPVPVLEIILVYSSALFLKGLDEFSN